MLQEYALEQCIENTAPVLRVAKLLENLGFETPHAGAAAELLQQIGLWGPLDQAALLKPGITSQFPAELAVRARLVSMPGQGLQTTLSALPASFCDIAYSTVLLGRKRRRPSCGTHLPIPMAQAART